jgi:hypothetical protein
MAVQEQLTRLQELLQEQVALHDTLHHTLAQEAELDGQLEPGALLRIQVTKHQCALRSQALEEHRMALVRQIAAATGNTAANLTLKQIIPLAPPEIGAELQRCHERLRATIEEIGRLTRETATNAHARLQAVEATLAVINEAVRMHPTYSEAGRLQNKTPTFKKTSA